MEKQSIYSHPVLKFGLNLHEYSISCYFYIKTYLVCFVKYNTLVKIKPVVTTLFALQIPYIKAVFWAPCHVSDVRKLLKIQDYNILIFNKKKAVLQQQCQNC